jgi:hypothetical protein
LAIYVTPQVEVFQDFTINPIASTNPLNAHISGGHAYLARYSVAAEQLTINLGYYDWIEPNSYNWPGRPAGGIVDDSYVKLWIQNGLLQYYQDLIGEGPAVTKVSGYNNRVQSVSTNFAVNGEYARDTALIDRDVKVGDIVKVRGVNNVGHSLTLWTSVQAVLSNVVAATVAAATTDADNLATESSSVAVDQISGPINTITLTPSDAEYNGLSAGDVIETYDIIVTTGSVASDLTTAVIRVISGSGDDNVAVTYPEASGTPTSIGTRGLTVTFAVTPNVYTSESAHSESVPPADLVAGQHWQVTVHQAFTKPVPASGGTYAGLLNTTYIVVVTRGGHYTDSAKPQISVSTTNGTDISGPTTVTASDTPVAVGTFGVTIEFSQSSLRTGDVYYIACFSASEGAMRTLVLNNTIDPSIVADTVMDLTLFILNPLLQISENRAGFAPATNWGTSATQITVNPGIIAYDPTWTESGVPQPLPVISESSKLYGQMFSEYRAWLSDLDNAVYAISDPGQLTTMISGSLDPDNPLMWGVSQALTNSNGSNVMFTAVANPDDLNSWADCLSVLIGNQNVYGLVPLTYDPAVLELYVAHVNAESSPEEASWRVLWVNNQDVSEIPVVSAGSTIPGYLAATTTNGALALATVTQDPSVESAAYTILLCTSLNANFLANGTQPGDIVRVQYVGDGFGNYTYSEYVIDTIVSEDEVTLLAGPASAVNVPSKFEVWRNQNATQDAASIARNSGTYGSRRVRATWPNQIGAGGLLMPGYFMNCALAGLCSGVLPQQGLTRLQITGFDDVSATTKKFNRDQLNTMAESGTWIVTQDPVTGNIYTRHAVTTGPYADINQREESLTRNIDSISFQFMNFFAPYIGVTNVTPTMEATIAIKISQLIIAMTNVLLTGTPMLGAQLNSAEVISFGTTVLFADRYVLTLDVSPPVPFNNLIVNLVV